MNIKTTLIAAAALASLSGGVRAEQANPWTALFDGSKGIEALPFKVEPPIVPVADKAKHLVRVLPVDRFDVEVSCREEGIDHGVAVEIRAGATDWLAQARVYQTTFIKSEDLGVYQVNRPHFPKNKPAGTTLSWKSANDELQLEVALTSSGAETVEARGTLKAAIRGADGRLVRLEKPVSCVMRRNEVRF